MRPILALLALCAPLPAAAQSFSGPAVAIDGDTLVMTDQRIRLHGIDAPEGSQTCERGGASWACGRDARALLAGLVAGRVVECTQRDSDIYGRIVATCRAGQSDLAATMVREGLAIALPRYSTDYLEIEDRAKRFKLALWGSAFQAPADYRAAHPELFRGPAQQIMARSARRAPQSRPAAVTYAAFRNCREARAAGAAPLYRGRPGYGAHLDGDGDGIACEPYRGS